MVAVNTVNFLECWKGKGNEKSDTQKFWLGLLRDILGVEKPEQFIEFEKPVALEHTSYIDAYIPSTRTVIEQKSCDVNLDHATLQSDGQVITPYQQAKRYYDGLPISNKGRYIVICNFLEFRVYDMEQPKAPPEVILLSSLEHDWYKLAFLVDTYASAPKDIREAELSVKAGELVGKLYDALLSRYINPDDERSQKSLNVFCVRIVFLLYAEDAGLFEKGQFHDYLKDRQNMARNALQDLFIVLSQDKNARDPYLEATLNAFPYVNGGLFDDFDIELPQLDGEPLRIIINDMSEGFNWSGISPTIFGSVFESTLNPDTRHSGGMHYTSIDNIHKCIDPLFLDELNSEFETILALPSTKKYERNKKTQKLQSFQKKIAALAFFDPACGSGNFLTETYLSLRRLENKILAELSKQISFTENKEETPIKVSISQFYGIEINDFAVAVARTALWIAEAQMWHETKSIVHFFGDPLPLKTFNNIHNDNALLTDWHNIVTPNDKLYIMGNPPFLGYSIQNREQKKNMTNLFLDGNGKPYRVAGKIDYIAGWFYKASDFICGTMARAAFVSTNSITQGEQVGWIFKPLVERFGIHIDFAYTTFTWNSEATDKAHVHVVIIGFNAIQNEEGNGRLKRLYTSEGLRLAENINFYLLPAPTVFTESRQNTLCPDEAPDMTLGNRPVDGGNLLLTAEEYEYLLKHEPKASTWIRRVIGAEEFINGNLRYCLWLVDATPQDIHDMPLIKERVRLCREDRLKGAPDRQKLADKPHLFRESKNPKICLVVPRHSSEKRYYIPMGFVSSKYIITDAVNIIPNATLYHFGILTSHIHMAWVRAVTGRIKSDYRYSKQIDYNCFVWPKPTEEQRAKIEATAQAILDARANHPESTFAALYDETSMPADLRKAHRHNDTAVCEAYGWHTDINELDIVARLFVLYQHLTAK